MAAETFTCTGVREESSGGRACSAGMQPMLIHWIFLKDVPWSMMDYQHATQGEVLSKKKSLGPSGGYESKAQK